jgi:type IV pilus assembly protein PilY1
MSPSKRVLAGILAVAPLFAPGGAATGADPCGASIAAPATVLAIASEGAVERKGKPRLSAKRLELGSQKGDALAAVRFEAIGIPQGAAILSAQLQLVSAKKSAKPALLEIRGEASGDAAAFGEAPYDLTARAATEAVVAWDVPEWPEAGVAHPTPQLAAVVQEIVDGSAWESGHALAFFFAGEGRRSAVGFAGDIGLPLLQIDYEAAAAACAD